VPFYFSLLEKNKQLAEVGTFIDKNSTDPVMAIALDYGDTQLLPGISAHSRLISFREEKEYNGFNFFLKPDEIYERIYASNVIRSLEQETSGAERCDLIKSYKLKFVLAQPKDSELFEKELSGCDMQASIVFRTKDLNLLALNKRR
jgi:hypothetical protein